LAGSLRAALFARFLTRTILEKILTHAEISESHLFSRSLGKFAEMLPAKKGDCHQFLEEIPAHFWGFALTIAAATRWLKHAQPIASTIMQM
jgi:hypothetical protein